MLKFKIGILARLGNKIVNIFLFLFFGMPMYFLGAQNWDPTNFFYNLRPTKAIFAQNIESSQFCAKTVILKLGISTKLDNNFENSHDFFTLATKMVIFFLGNPIKKLSIFFLGGGGKGISTKLGFPCFLYPVLPQKRKKKKVIQILGIPIKKFE